MSDVTQTPEGLRERKRAALIAAIERTALDLATEHGYDGVTVDMICDASMVSQRTFFNYFGSKEGAVLGLTPPMPSEDEIDGFVDMAGSSVLGDFVGLITTSFTEHQPDPEMFRSRRALIQRTPELFNKESGRMAELEDQFVRIVSRRLHAEARRGRDEASLEEEARMVVSLTTGVMHYVMRRWSTSGFTGNPHPILRSSIELIRRVTSTDPSSS